MSDLNAAQNRVVWFDLPVADLERAAVFYRGVLGIKVHVEKTAQFSFAVLDHDQGNGGCLVPKAGEVSASAGVLIYLNANGRLREAVREVEALGGKVVEAPHPLGPHGFRAIVIDSEGNRIALHAQTDS